MGNLLRRVADWCVPASALRWGVLTGPEHWIACPRCLNTDMWGHASNEPEGFTCVTCGWVRYWDPWARRLVDAPSQSGSYRFDRPPGLATQFDTTVSEDAGPAIKMWDVDSPSWRRRN